MQNLKIGQMLDPTGPVEALPGAADTMASQIPEPCTYHILCVLPEASKEYDSGILKADKVIQYEELLSPVLFVAKIGPDAFKDEARFPHGPSCKVGDFVIVRPNSGTRLKIHGREMRLINDDSVQGTIEDPRGVGRV